MAILIIIIIGCFALLWYLSTRRKLVSAIYEPSSTSLEGLDKIKIKWSDGSESEYKGSSTVWYHYPAMVKCSTLIDCDLSQIRQYYKEHGNPYPTAHLSK
jgi:hypothetical protein